MPEDHRRPQLLSNRYQLLILLISHSTCSPICTCIYYHISLKRLLCTWNVSVGCSWHSTSKEQGATAGMAALHHLQLLPVSSFISKPQTQLFKKLK